MGHQLALHQLRDWMRSKHVLIYVSRGEGNGRPPKEMAATGGASICTAGMGMKWLADNPDLGYPIDFTWAKVPDGVAGQVGGRFNQGHWMEPDFDQLVETFRSIDIDRTTLAKKAHNVTDYALRGWRWEKTAQQVWGIIDSYRK
jgi:hypothetical protein